MQQGFYLELEPTEPPVEEPGMSIEGLEPIETQEIDLSSEEQIGDLSIKTQE
jgi:hypothetical protein